MSQASALRRFAAHVAVTRADPGLMFGCPTLKLNGQLYAMLRGEDIMLRVSPDDRAELIALGAKPFEPKPGTKSKKTVVLPTSIVKSTVKLRAWVTKAATFALSQGSAARAAPSPRRRKTRR